MRTKIEKRFIYLFSIFVLLLFNNIVFAANEPKLENNIVLKKSVSFVGKIYETRKLESYENNPVKIEYNVNEKEGYIDWVVTYFEENISPAFYQDDSNVFITLSKDMKMVGQVTTIETIDENWLSNKTKFSFEKSFDTSKDFYEAHKWENGNWNFSLWGSQNDSEAQNLIVSNDTRFRADKIKYFDGIVGNSISNGEYVVKGINTDLRASAGEIFHGRLNSNQYRGKLVLKFRTTIPRVSNGIVNRDAGDQSFVSATYQSFQNFRTIMATNGVILKTTQEKPTYIEITQSYTNNQRPTNQGEVKFKRTENSTEMKATIENKDTSFKYQINDITQNEINNIALSVEYTDYHGILKSKELVETMTEKLLKVNFDVRKKLNVNDNSPIINMINDMSAYLFTPEFDKKHQAALDTLNKITDSKYAENDGTNNRDYTKDELLKSLNLAKLLNDTYKYRMIKSRIDDINKSNDFPAQSKGYYNQATISKLNYINNDIRKLAKTRSDNNSTTTTEIKDSDNFYVILTGLKDKSAYFNSTNEEKAKIDAYIAELSKYTYYSTPQSDKLVENSEKDKLYFTYYAEPRNINAVSKDINLKNKITEIDTFIRNLSGKNTDLTNLQNLIRVAEDTKVQELLKKPNIAQNLKDKLKSELALAKKYVKSNVSQGVREVDLSTKDADAPNRYISQALADQKTKDLNAAIEALKEAEINLLKEEIKKQVNDLGLDKSDLDKILAGIDKATTEEELNNILEDAKKLKELKLEKDKTKQEILNKKYLTTAQRNKFNELIDGSKTKDYLEKILIRATAVDNAMKSLREEIVNKTVKNTSKYTEAEKTKKDTYDTKLAEAEKMIAETYEELTETKISNTATELLNARLALDGDTVLANKKIEAATEISKLNNLNDKQKADVLEKIKNSTNSNDVDANKNKATELNTAMGTLIAQVAKDAGIKGLPKYKNAEKEKQVAYDTALQEAKKVSEKTGELADKTKVEELYNKLKAAYEALDGEAKLEKSKQDAIAEIDKFENLNDKQKQNIKDKINKATTDTEIDGIKKDAKALDDAMKELKDLVASKENTKTENKYTTASDNFKKEYDKQKDLADNLIKKEGDNKTLEEVKALKDSLTNAYNNLDGDKQLDQVKELAKTQIEAMPNLNNKQKEVLKQKVDSATDKNDIQPILDEARKLDDAMKALKDEIEKLRPLLSSPEYLEATPEKKTNYSKKVTESVPVIKTTGDNKTLDEVTKLTEELKNLREDLDGIQRFEEAKKQAKAEIDGKTNLNKAQKDALKEKVDNATSVFNINDKIKPEINELDTAMAELKAEKEKAEKAKSESNYINAESNLKDKLNTELGKATGIVDVNGANADKKQIDTIKEELKAAVSALNGDAELQKSKDEAKLNLNNLNNAQKNDINSKIDKAQTVDEVSKIRNEATTLDNAMSALKQAEKTSEPVKETDNYKLASEDKKKLYDEALAAVKKVTPETGELKNTTEVNDLKSKLEYAEKLLDGNTNLKNKENKKDNAINELGTYLNLNNNQKNAAIEAIKAAQTDEEIDKKLAEAKDLDNAMGTLINEEGEFKKVELTAKYKEATLDKKNKYDEEYKNTLNVTNKVTGQNLDKQAVEEQYKKLSEARKALDGDSILSDKKKEILEKIKNYENLNNAQKQYLEVKVENATDISDLEKIAKNAELLDKNMKILKDHVKKSDVIKADERYKESDPDFKKEYDNYVDAAKTIVDKTNGPAKSVFEVDELIKELEKYEKLVLIKKITLSQYDPILDALNYKDTSITNRFNDNLYFDIYLNKSFTTLIGGFIKDGLKLYPLDLFMGGQLGFNIDVADNVKVGGFIEYMNKGLNHISVGANAKGTIDGIHNILGFVRYRLALGKAEENGNNLLGHNLDAYLKYSANVKKGDITLMPKVGIYLSYLDKIKLEDNVELSSRLSAVADLGAEISYESGPNRIYIEELVKFTLNDKFVLTQTDLPNNKHTKDFELFEFISRIGWEYTVNNYKFGLNTEINHNGNFKMGINNSYNW